jgi:hypothetical protein
MKKNLELAGLGLILIGVLIANAQTNATISSSFNDKNLSAQLEKFVAEKEIQAQAFAKTTGKAMPSEFNSFFTSAAKGDYKAATNFFGEMLKHSPQYDAHGEVDENMRGPIWECVKETASAFELFAKMDDKYAVAYGNDIIKSIPDGSIYFGGTDPGRFLVTALSKSQVNGKPFFTLTQNALVDGSYLEYLRLMYGKNIYFPTSEDIQKSFQDYSTDVRRRAQNHELEPGENSMDDKNNQIQISGQIGVMKVNGLLVKTIFDKNPDRQFYIEESFPLDWMYPNLEPHGLIMKINRQPIASLSVETIQKDRHYWTKCISPMIGNWLNDTTSVKAIAEFSEKVYLQNDFENFKGDRSFVENQETQKMFSKERVAIAGIYFWRLQHASDASEKGRMATEADFAFRQALALCPYSPEVVVRYVNFLSRQNRMDDALLVAETAAKFPSISGSDHLQFQGLIDLIRKFQKPK